MKKLLLLSILAVSLGCLARASSSSCAGYNNASLSSKLLSYLGTFLSQNNMGTIHNFSDKLFDLRHSDLKKLKNFFKSKGVDYDKWMNSGCQYFQNYDYRPNCKKMKLDDLNNWLASKSQYYKNYKNLLDFMYNLTFDNTSFMLGVIGYFEASCYGLPPGFGEDCEAGMNNEFDIVDASYSSPLIAFFNNSALRFIIQLGSLINCAKIRP